MPLGAGLVSRLQLLQGISAGTNIASSGTVNFVNSNGVTFGLDTNNNLTASAVGGAGGNFSAGVSTLGHTQGNTGTISNQLILNGGPNITLSQSTDANGATVRIAGADQTPFNAGVSTMGNTAGTTGIVGSELFFVGGANITLSQSNDLAGLGTITFIGGAGAGGVAIADSANTISNNTVVFSNLNGVSFGLNGSTMTASIVTTYLTSQSNQAFSAQGGSSAFQTLNFSNANGATFTNTNGQVGLSYTVPTVTNSSWTVSDAATSGTVGRLAFTNLNGVTLSLSTGAAGLHTIVGSHNALTSQSNQAASASNGSFAFQTINFTNANNVTFGTSAGSIISASVAAQSNQTLGLYAISNTTGASTSSTVDARSFSIEGAGIASVGLTNGSFVVSVPAQGATGAFSAGVSTLGNSGGITGTVSNQIVFVGGNNITLSETAVLGSATISIIGGAGAGGGFSAGVSTDGNTAGSTGTVSGQIEFVGGSNVTLSQSSNGANATITFNAPAPSDVYRKQDGQFFTQGTSQINSINSIQPFIVQYPVVCSNIMCPMSITVVTTSNTSSAYIDITFQGAIYTRNVLTLSSIIAFNNTLTQFWQSNSTASVDGLQALTATFAGTTLTPGQYWLAVQVSTSNSATGGANTTALGNSCNMFYFASLTQATVVNIHPWGDGSHASQGVIGGLGFISSNNTQPTIALSNITGTGSFGGLANIYFELRNNTWW